MTSGLLLVNVGTPDSLAPRDIRRYLLEFMSDPLVIDRTGPWWRFLLRHVIVPRRAPASARAYAAIWNRERDESPLRTITRAQAAGVQAALDPPGDIRVGWAMRYGRPTIAAELARLRDAGCAQVLVAPLYPQFSAATTGTVETATRAALATMADPPALRFLPPWFDHPAYIRATAAGIQDHVRALDWAPQALVLSFHGLPQAHVDRGDPYCDQCLKTAGRLSAALGEQFGEVHTAFQSRGRRIVWTGPELEPVLADLARQGVGRVCVATPGFVADCLETVEEVGLRAARHFLANGGKRFTRIPCLNDTPAASAMVAGIAREHLAGWFETGLTPPHAAHLALHGPAATGQKLAVTP